MKRLKIKEPINLSTADNPYVLVLKSMVESYTFYGTLTLGANFAITANGTPKPGMICILMFDSAITPAGNTFTVLGTVINSKIITSPFFCIAEYTRSKWVVVSHNLATAKADGITIIDTAGVLGVGTIGNTQFSSSDKLVYAKMTLTGSLKNADLTSDAAIDLSKLATVSATKVIVSDGNGYFTTTTGCTIEELSALSGISSAIQTQLDALAGTFADYYTSSEITAIIADYSTTSAMNAAISSAISGLVVIKNITTLATTTDLSTVGTLYQEYLLNATSGAVGITLPHASSLVANAPIKFTLIGAANPSTITPKGTDRIYGLNTAEAASKTLTAIGDHIQLISNGSNSWQVVEEKIT